VSCGIAVRSVVSVDARAGGLTRLCFCRTIDYAMQMATQNFTAALQHVGGQVSEIIPQYV
jgi:hypothetical protein